MISRVYIDTSVVGGCEDDEFKVESRAVLEMARKGGIVLLLSDLLIAELESAPPHVQAVLARIPAAGQESIQVTEEARQLLGAYLKAKVVGPRFANDALHIALATVARADLLLSWNFKHIVHLDKIKKFNAINLLQGYALLEIRSPREFV